MSTTKERKLITSVGDFIRWDNDKKLEMTEFFVEANSFEQLMLWRENYKNKSEDERLEWIQDTSGFMRLIGFVDKKQQKPIYISCSFYAIGGRYVCFYYASGTYADWNQIKEFINKHAPKYDKGTRTAETDAMNFGHCLSFCKGECD